MRGDGGGWGGMGAEMHSQPRKRGCRRLEEVAKAVGGGYCRLQMPLKLALGVRGTVAGHMLGGLGGGGGVPPPLPMHPGGRGASRLSEYAGWRFRVYVRVRLRRRGCAVRGWGGWSSTGRAWGVEGARSRNGDVGGPLHNATATMSPLRTRPTRWGHGFGGWRLAFCLPHPLGAWLWGLVPGLLPPPPAGGMALGAGAWPFASPTRWGHGFGGWRLAFCLPRGQISVSGGDGRGWAGGAHPVASTFKCGLVLLRREFVPHQDE